MQALNDIKVLDLSWVMAGPQVSRCLADFGATVIKVESFRYPDIMRTIGPYRDDINDLNHSAYFASLNCNKYGISLDMRKPKAISLAKRLVAWADVVLENFAPGVIDKWGLGYNDLAKINPGLIMLSFSIQGQTGPHSQGPGWGSVAEGISGLTSLSGWTDRLPSITQYVWGDIIAPRFALAALLSALDYRRKTGKGQYLDVSQLESIGQLLGTDVLDYEVNGTISSRSGNRASCVAPQNVYRCLGEDAWCAISVTSDEQWRSLCKLMGADSVKDLTFEERKEREDELDSLITRWTSKFVAVELMSLLQKHGILAGVVSSPADLNQDPQLVHRGFWRLESPDTGTFAHDTWGFQLSLTPAEPKIPAPRLGEHNHYVCTKILGIKEDEFTELVAEGVFN